MNSIVLKVSHSQVNIKTEIHLVLIVLKFILHIVQRSLDVSTKLKVLRDEVV